MNLRHYVEQKKPETVEYIIYDSTYMMFKNKQNYGDRGQKSGYLCGKELKILIGKGVFWVVEINFSFIWVAVTQE